LVNDLLTIRLPRDPETALASLAGRKGCPLPEFWRVDAESSDGSFSIALGLIQRLAELNPDMRFTTISSDYFRPSDMMLAWLAELPNVWVGHTVSAFFTHDDLDSRFGSIARYIEAGVPTAVWVTTHWNWDNQAVLDRVLDLASPEQIIEAPLSHSTQPQELSVFNINPLGSCASNRYDRRGRLCVPVDGAYRVPLDTGEYAEPCGVPHAKCKACTVRCGHLALSSKLDSGTPKGHTPAGSKAECGQRFAVGDLLVSGRDLAVTPGKG
jgi:hypothetical protein